LLVALCVQQASAQSIGYKNLCDLYTYNYTNVNPAYVGNEGTNNAKLIMLNQSLIDIRTFFNTLGE